jgi:hypothetical protein
VLLTVFAPASFFYDALKFTGRLWIAPFDWALKKLNPNYVNDVTNKKDQIASSIKNKADKSIFTMSSFIAK